MGVTIKDLARETGLTAATISAYFNGADGGDDQRLFQRGQCARL